MIEPVPLALDFLPNALWESAVGFIMAVCAFVSGMGATSGSMTVAAVSGYSIFAYYAIHADITIVTQVFMATLVLFAIGFGFKVWRLEGAD